MTIDTKRIQVLTQGGMTTKVILGTEMYYNQCCTMGTGAELQFNTSVWKIRYYTHG